MDGRTRKKLGMMAVNVRQRMGTVKIVRLRLMMRLVKLIKG
jgi:hypothetical protein